MANEDGFGVVAWRRRENTPARLRAWLAKVLDAPDLAITNFRSPTDNGASSQTFLISAGYTAGGNSRTHEIVVRQEPAEDPPFMDPRFGVWANAQAAIAARSTIVAPKVLGVELDPDVLGSPFFAMERIAGAIPADRPPYRIGGWVSEASARARECMWRSAIQRLVEVHRADWHSLGLEPLFRGGGKGKSELDAQIDYLAAYNVWANDGNKTPLVARAEAWLRARKPKQERLRLCWGDARPANMVFDAELCVGLLDWELVTIGDPVQDLAWWTFSERMFDSLIGTANLQGCLSGDALLDAYAEISGEPMLNFDYYDVYNMFRCVAIITRQTRVRDRLGQPPTPGFTSTDNFALRRLAQRLEQLN